MATKKQKKVKQSKNDRSATDQKQLLAFLQDTKNGRYAKIDPKSLEHLRRSEENSAFNSEEDYIYSIR